MRQVHKLALDPTDCGVDSQSRKLNKSFDFHFVLMSRQSAALSFATQHASEIRRKTEYESRSFSTRLGVGCVGDTCLKLKNIF